MREIRLRAYINSKGTIYAVRDRARRGQGILWVPCYRTKDGRKWQKIPKAVYHTHITNAQLELDVYARQRGYKEEARHGNE